MTGRFSLVAGETLEHVLMAPDEQKYLVSSDAGYGFICTFSAMVSRNKAGKALLNLPSGAKVFRPLPVLTQECSVVTVTTEGRMLVFSLDQLPELGKGKGNKIIQIPTARVQSREEYVKQMALVPPGESVVLKAGKRKLTLKPSDLEHYRGDRGRRGNKLPRGLQRVEEILLESEAVDE